MQQENQYTESILYSEDKTVYTKIPYKDGVPDGRTTTYKNDELIQEYFYKAGKLNGTLSFYDKGILRTKIEFEDGLQNGEAMYYGDNSNLVGKENFLNGMKQGLSEWYSVIGEIILRQNFHEDKLHGEKTEYNKGQIKKRYYYENGNLINEEASEKNNTLLQTYLGY